MSAWFLLSHLLRNPGRGTFRAVRPAAVFMVNHRAASSSPVRANVWCLATGPDIPLGGLGSVGKHGLGTHFAVADVHRPHSRQRARAPKAAPAGSGSGPG
jgi:hypothetical protein